MKINNTECVDLLLGLSVQTVLDDWSWKVFGYKKRPRRGSLFNRFVSEEKLIKETFLIREFFIVSCATGIQSLPKSVTEVQKKLICAQVVGNLLKIDDILSSLRMSSIPEAQKYLIHGINSYLEEGIDNTSSVFIERAKTFIGKHFNNTWLLYASVFMVSDESPLAIIKQVVREKYPN